MLDRTLAGLAFSGTTNPNVNGPFGALFQDVVAPELQGRVFTVLGSMTALAVPLGMMPSFLKTKLYISRPAPLHWSRARTSSNA
jgi:hypothetical protein